MRLKLIPTMIGGCAVGDYDGDGRPDLYVTNSIPRWGKPNTDSCGRLYRNLGGGRFEDVTAKAGIRACGLGMGAFWADLDGDGRLDLYLTNMGPNVVWWNRGDGTFEEGKDTGLEDPLFSVGAGFLDYDGDGRLDVAVANYLDSTPEWEASQKQFELRVPEDYVGQPSHLFRNLGGPQVRRRHAGGGARRPAGRDEDARRGRPRLRRRRQGGPLLRQRPRLQPPLPQPGRRPIRGDDRRDGRRRSRRSPARGDGGRRGRPLRRRPGEPLRDELRKRAQQPLRQRGRDALRGRGHAPPGSRTVGRASVRWGTHFADFDNDGWPDLYAVGGHLAPRLPRLFGRYRTAGAAYVEAGDSAFAQKSVLLHNLGGGRFVEWTESGDLGSRRMSARGTAVADLDGDGALDLVVVDVDGPVRIFRNEVGDRSSWVAIEPAQWAGRSVRSRHAGARDDGGSDAGADLPRVAVVRLGVARAAPLRTRVG